MIDVGRCTFPRFSKGEPGGICLFILFLLLTGPALAAINAYEFKNPVDEQRFRTLIAELRCPKCQNQNIADSNAPLSQDLRQRIYELIQEGRSDTEIVQFLAARYGDFITYRPPIKPLTWGLWFGPLVLIGLAAAGLALWIRRRGREATPELDEQERARLQALLQQEKSD